MYIVYICCYPSISGNAIGSTSSFPIQDVLFFLYFIFIILTKISCHLAILSSSVLPNFCTQFIANKPVLTLNTDRPTHPGMEKSNLSKKIHLH